MVTCILPLVTFPRVAAADPPRPFVGVRAGAQTWYFDRFDSPAGLRGGAFAVDAGLQLTPMIGAYVFGEYGIYDERDDRLPAGPAASSDAVGIGARLRTPENGSIAFVLDLGVAWRRLRLPYDAPDAPTRREEDFSGLEWLRLRAGPTFALGAGFWADLGIGFSLGRFDAATHAPQTCAVTDACSDSKVDDPTPSTHAIVDLTAGLHYSF